MSKATKIWLGILVIVIFGIGFIQKQFDIWSTIKEYVIVETSPETERLTKEIPSLTVNQRLTDFEMKLEQLDQDLKRRLTGFAYARDLTELRNNMNKAIEVIQKSRSEEAARVGQLLGQLSARIDAKGSRHPLDNQARKELLALKGSVRALRREIAQIKSSMTTSKTAKIAKRPSPRTPPRQIPSDIKSSAVSPTIKSGGIGRSDRGLISKNNLQIKQVWKPVKMGGGSRWSILWERDGAAGKPYLTITNYSSNGEFELPPENHPAWNYLTQISTRGNFPDLQLDGSRWKKWDQKNF